MARASLIIACGALARELNWLKTVNQWAEVEIQCLDAAQRANGIWKQMLADYEAPPMDPAIDEALLDFMAREKASFADRDY